MNYFNLTIPQVMRDNKYLAKCLDHIIKYMKILDFLQGL